MIAFNNIQSEMYEITMKPVNNFDVHWDVI